jgi:hypothetical protein
VGQVAPVLLRDVHAVRAGRCPYALPGLVPFLVGDAFHLVEARNCDSHVRRVTEGFFALGREGELRVREAILLRGAQALRTARDVLSVGTLALHLTSLLDVPSCSLFLLLR